MPKTLDDWVLELRKQFDGKTLMKCVARAKITIGLVDTISGEIQYHTLEYKSKQLKGGEDDKRRNGIALRQERPGGMDEICPGV